MSSNSLYNFYVGLTNGYIIIVVVDIIILHNPMNLFRILEWAQIIEPIFSFVPKDSSMYLKMLLFIPPIS